MQIEIAAAGGKDKRTGDGRRQAMMTRSLVRSCTKAAGRSGPGSQMTLRWREVDSNFWYRGTEAVDFRSSPGIAGVSAGFLNDTT
jgi:hypothetical protein